MADLSTLMGVSADNISAYNGIDAGTINTVMGLTWPHGPQYVGDVWGGGYYFGTLGGYYLIAAAAEGSSYAYKTSQTSTTGADSDTDGYANLQAMITAGITDHPSGNYCNNLSSGGYSDWYPPAIDELELLYSVKSTLESYGASFTSNVHWSSTQYLSTFARTVDFSDGTSSYMAKNLTGYYTTAIRRVAI